MNSEAPYPIGTPGNPWGDEEKKAWFNRQKIQRSYKEQVLEKLQPLTVAFELIQYGALPIDEQRYPLFILQSKQWQANKKTVLVTGGVHGYETSGVQGAIRFVADQVSLKTQNIASYCDEFNIIVAPCVSPWGYETINRWNASAIDPNRSFYAHSPAPESAALMRYIQSLGCNIDMHIDLHETTDTDNSEFRPALAARDATVHSNWNIPDGFYLVGNTPKPAAAFQKAIIDNVEKVTHIAPADENNQLIGVPVEQWGVINYAGRELGLCMGLTDADLVTTTEVYPDSEQADDENCILAQVAAIHAAIDYLKPR